MKGIKRPSRNSYELTPKAKEILETVKDNLNINKDRFLSMSVEFVNENKELFSDFIKGRTLETLNKVEEK